MLAVNINERHDKHILFQVVLLNACPVRESHREVVASDANGLTGNCIRRNTEKNRDVSRESLAISLTALVSRNNIPDFRDTPSTGIHFGFRKEEWGYPVPVLQGRRTHECQALGCCIDLCDDSRTRDDIGFLDSASAHEFHGILGGADFQFLPYL